MAKVTVVERGSKEFMAVEARVYNTWCGDNISIGQDSKGLAALHYNAV